MAMQLPSHVDLAQTTQSTILQMLGCSSVCVRVRGSLHGLVVDLLWHVLV